jgi:hypothetical protein
MQTPFDLILIIITSVTTSCQGESLSLRKNFHSKTYSVLLLVLKNWFGTAEVASAIPNRLTFRRGQAAEIIKYFSLKNIQMHL